MSDIEALHRTYGRLADGEPIRVLIGEKLYAATEIVLLPPAAARLRGVLLDDIAARIADLTPPPGEPISPAQTVPDDMQETGS